MKRYSEYKDSGVAWIGEIPSHWEVKKIKYLVSEIISGGTPDTNNIDYWDFEKNSGVPWVAINDMSKSDFIKDSTAYITINGVKSKRLKIIPKGSLIYSIYATIGKVSELCIDATINQALLGLIVDENIIDKKYMKFSLNAIEKSISSLGSLNTQNNLNLEKVRNIELSIPSLKEQKKIASYLDKKISQIETFISKKEELIETLKASRTKLISETVTKGLDKNVPMKDSGVEWIGDIPSHWEVKKLGFSLNVRSSRRVMENQYSDEGIPFYRSKEIVELSQNIEPTTNIFIDQSIYNKLKYSAPKKGDLLITAIGTIGQSWISDGRDFYYKDGNLIQVDNSEEIKMEYLQYLTQTSNFNKEIKILSEGSTLVALTIEKLNNIKIICPSNSEQTKIVNYLDKKTRQIDTLILAIEKQIELLKKAKQKLITEVVTGKIDVTNL